MSLLCFFAEIKNIEQKEFTKPSPFERVDLWWGQKVDGLKEKNEIGIQENSRQNNLQPENKIWKEESSIHFHLNNRKKMHSWIPSRVGQLQLQNVYI